MRILHLITRMDGGGSAVNTLISATAQQQAGHRTCLAFGSSDESEMSETEREQLAGRMQVFREAGGETVVLSSLVRQPGRADFAAYRQMRQLLVRGFDVVHTHTSKAGALGRLAAWGCAGAVVHTPHGHIFHGYFGRLKTRLFIGIERFLAARSHALIALTQAERDDHLALGVGRVEQWRVIPSGVDVTGIQRRVMAWREDYPDARQWDAISVGRLAPIKGMERLIRAWARVCEIKSDARLAVVGDGEEREKLEKMCGESGIANNVYFAGWSDPVPYFAASRCFALLSHNEGMGRAVVEAMAAGLPCVVSGVCGLKELVTSDCGAVMDAENPKAVAAALLYDWPDDMHTACVERADAYSVDVMVQALQDLYDGLLNGA
ncbi:MAG: glycosyltransferase family 4 protein [Zetaproteobacteria bacterium]|nr:MAG: glycosyltransferase family 4 protein [Zetaproteobacteria bacterium]